MRYYKKDFPSSAIVGLEACCAYPTIVTSIFRGIDRALLPERTLNAPSLSFSVNPGALKPKLERHIELMVLIVSHSTFIFRQEGG